MLKNPLQSPDATLITSIALYVTKESIIVWTLKTKSLLPPFTKGRNSPLW